MSDTQEHLLKSCLAENISIYFWVMRTHTFFEKNIENKDNSRTLSGAELFDRDLYKCNWGTDDSAENRMKYQMTISRLKIFDAGSGMA